MKHFWSGFIKKAEEKTKEEPKLDEINSKLDILVNKVQEDEAEKQQAQHEQEKEQAFQQGQAQAQAAAPKPETMRGKPVQEVQTQ